MFTLTTANDIELKYGPKDWDLIWEYIGPDRTHGDCYYNNEEYRWYEVTSPVNDLIYSNGTPNALICISENQYLPLSIHIAIFEVSKPVRGEGIGTQVIMDLLSTYKELGFKSATLQCRNSRAAKFYKKIGFTNRKINKVPIMRKYL